MNDTKPIRILFWLPLLLLAGGATLYFFWITTQDALIRPLYHPTETEWITYLLLMLTAALFYWMVQTHADGATKIIAPLMLALAVTVVVLLLNTFWRYVAIGTFLHWDDYPSYSLLLREDLLYHEDWGWTRYPLCFATSFLLCGAKPLLELFVPLVHLFHKLWVCEETDHSNCCDQCPNYGTCYEVE